MSSVQHAEERDEREGCQGDIMKVRKYAFAKCIWKEKCFSVYKRGTGKIEMYLALGTKDIFTCTCRDLRGYLT